MSSFSILPVIEEHLKGLPILKNATIVQDFVSPSTARPVLTPLVAVGIKTMEMLPTSRLEHTVNAVVKLTMLFPCGVGTEEEISHSETVYVVASTMVGQSFLSMTVESVEVSKTAFDKDMYGIYVEMDLHMKGHFNRASPINTQQGTETYSIGTVELDRIPEAIKVERSSDANTAVKDAPLVITVEGSSASTPGGELWNSLHTLMSAGQTVNFTLPRTDTALAVRPDSIETACDLCGYGFTYKLVFCEAG